MRDNKGENERERERERGREREGWQVRQIPLIVTLSLSLVEQSGEMDEWIDG